MPEVIGDIVQPSEFVLPVFEAATPTLSGQMFISGHKIHFVGESGTEVVTSS